MAVMEPGRNEGGKEASRRNGVVKEAAGRRFTSVNFEELNYEQRRPPYNSGSRMMPEEDNDRMHEYDNPGGTPVPNE